MPPVRITEDFQVTIPEEVRRELSLRPGMEFEVLPMNGRIELIPSVDARELRGFAKGIDTSHIREKGPK
jgi:AbrB family looped-hinge helix DNA binding protein